MKEFYANLQKKRKEQGLTLTTIQQNTRLPLQYLEAIEAGEMHKLPEAYSRMYLRRYARELGVDVDETLRDFDLLTGKLSPAEANAAKDLAEGKKRAQAQPLNSVKESIDDVNLDKVNNYFWPVLIGLLFVFGTYFVYQHYSSESSQSPTTVKEITIGELVERTTQPDSAVADSLTARGAELTLAIPVTAPSPDQTAITIELLSNDSVWVKEVKDMRDTTDYILVAGRRRTLTAQSQVDLVIGRADALVIRLNGKDLGVIGNRDQVASLTLTPDGITRKRLVNTPR